MARFEVSLPEAAVSAAPGGRGDAMFELGLAYSTGRDMEPDLVEAHKWFNLAALRGSKRAKAYRMELAEEMTRVQLREAQRLARNWLQVQRSDSRN